MPPAGHQASGDQLIEESARAAIPAGGQDFLDALPGGIASGVAPTCVGRRDDAWFVCAYRAVVDLALQQLEGEPVDAMEAVILPLRQLLAAESRHRERPLEVTLCASHHNARLLAELADVLLSSERARGIEISSPSGPDPNRALLCAGVAEQVEVVRVARQNALEADFVEAARDWLRELPAGRLARCAGEEAAAELD